MGKRIKFLQQFGSFTPPGCVPGPLVCPPSGFAVQGDDYNGGVGSAPAYADDAAFSAYVTNGGSGGAGTYNDYYLITSPINAVLDPTSCFNGHQMLQLVDFGWGNRFSAGGNFGDTPAAQNHFWARSQAIFAGFSDGGNPLNRANFFEVAGAVSGEGVFFQWNDGNLVLRSIIGFAVDQDVDCGLDTQLITGQVMDVIILVSSGTITVWVGPSCGLRTEIGTLTWTPSDDNFTRINFYGFAVGTGVSANIKSGSWEVVKFSESSNPFSV